MNQSLLLKLLYIFSITIFSFPLIAVNKLSEDQRPVNWPAWKIFKESSLAPSGRVIDHSDKRKITTSEGQSYALFFALVANEQEVFSKILNWTQSNLAQGDLAQYLPAWLWGKHQNKWQVIDSNSASDADLWIAYSLIQAGNLWNKPAYIKLGKLIAKNILEQETAIIKNLGLSLLPGAMGFIKYDSETKQIKSWKLNPSYVPIQIMASLSLHNSDPRWLELLHSSQKMLLQTSNNGFSVNWAMYKNNGYQYFDNENSIGSYDAIRVYLWAGMLHNSAPFKQKILSKLYGMNQATLNKSVPPISTNSYSGRTNGIASTGFSAALLPFLKSTNYIAFKQQQMRLKENPIVVESNSYYAQVLNLFGNGWAKNKYHFDRTGNLVPEWFRKNSL